MTELNKLIQDAALSVLLEAREPPWYFRLVFQDQKRLRSAFEHYFASHTQKIPRIIHQIWIGPRRPPWKWIETFRREMTAQYPQWEHRLWREPEIDKIELRHRDQYQTERRLYGKADLLRYEILHQFGGVYVDADMVWLHKSLDPLLNECCPSGFFVGRECQESVANSVIGCSPQNPLMDLVLRVISSRYQALRGEFGFEPWLATGPRFLTEVLQEFPCHIFPARYFYPVSWHGLDPAVDTSKFQESFMLQYGYSTNGLDVQ